MIGIEQLKELAHHCYWHYTEEEYKKALAKLNNPSSDEIVESALEGLKNKDRNIRVAMLWVLAREKNKSSIKGILLGLNDVKRRVRRVAIKSCLNYLDNKQITEKLLSMIEDDNETRKIRNGAFGHLTGGFLSDNIPQSVKTYVRYLSTTEKYRNGILMRLIQSGKLTQDIKELLKEYVDNGTKEQAIWATKALCGYKIVHCGDERKKFKNNYEPAMGDVYFWVKREEE